MNILFFDTETTGLPEDRLPIDHPDQPHVVQLAALLTRDDGTNLAGFSVVVNPGVPIPKRASDIHGITDDVAQQVGLSPKSALGLFVHFYRRAGLIVAHNIKFDRHLMAIMAARAGDPSPSFDRDTFCTMENSAPIVNLPPSERMIAVGITKPKPPKLEEAVRFFFNEQLENAHDAMADVVACRRVYFAIKERLNG